MTTLSKRFLDGLAKHYLTRDDIENGNYSYCGGDKGQHVKYWNIKTRGKNIQRPSKTHECVCGHEISHNFYIANDDYTNIMVLGSTCIKKFIGTKRTCSVCGVAHKNRIVDRCNECRKGLCDSCDRLIDEKYKKCYRCNKWV